MFWEIVTDGNLYWSALGGILPAGLWLWFWLKEDKARPEPKKLIGLVFALGAISVLPAFVLERLAKDIFFNETAAVADSLLVSTGLVIVWVIIEELVKFGAVALAVFRNRDYDEPVDAMIYLVTAALGFAAVENSLYLLGDIRAGLDLATFTLTGNLRFIGATILHVASSGIFGFGLALGFYARGWRRRIAGWGGLILAVGLHAFFNLSIINLSQVGRSAESEVGLGQIFQVFLLLWLAAILVILLFEKAKAIKKL